MSDSIRHRSKVLNGLNGLKDAVLFCDVTIVTTIPEINSIECHRIVLFSSSSYFSDIFSKNQSEKLIEEYTFSYPIVLAAINFLYTGHIDITLDNVRQLLDLSIKWKTQYLFTQTLEFICEHLNRDNVLEYYNLAFELRFQNLIEATSVLIRKHFNELWRKLRDLSKEAIIHLLHHNEINVESEDLIYALVIDWHEKHIECDLAPVLQLVRFDEMNEDYLEQLRHDPHMSSDPDSVLALALEYRHTGTRYDLQRGPRYWGENPRQKKNKSTLTEPLRANDPQFEQHAPNYTSPYSTNDHIVCITSNNKFVQYVQHTMCWEDLVDVPRWYDCGSSMCVYKKGVIIIGANNPIHGTCAAYANFKTRRVTELPPLEQAISFAGIVQFHNVVFVIGGSTAVHNTRDCSNRFRKLRLIDDYGWEDLAHLPNAVSSPSIIVDNMNIYVAGGNQSLYPTRYFQVYNFHTRHWTIINDIPEACSLFSCSIFKNNDQITLLTLTSCWTYDTIGQWSGRSHNKQCDQIQSVSINDQLIVFTQEINEECSSHEYDIRMNKWNVCSINATDVLKPNTVMIL